MSTKKKVILIFESNPKGTDNIRSLKEYIAIEKVRKTCHAKSRYKLETCPGATRDHFLRAISKYRPSIIHFIGHGTKDKICIENKDGKIDILTQDNLISIFEPYAKFIDCIILNACNTYGHTKELAKFIPVTIGTNCSIDTKNAENYAESFYRGLFDSESYKTAHEHGVISLSNSQQDAYKPLFTTREELEKQKRLNHLKENWFDYLTLRDLLASQKLSRKTLRLLCKQCFPIGKIGQFPKGNNCYDIIDWMADRNPNNNYPPLLIFLKLFLKETKTKEPEQVSEWLNDACEDRDILVNDLQPFTEKKDNNSSPIYVLVEIWPIQKTSELCNAQVWLYQNNTFKSILVYDAEKNDDAIHLAPEGCPSYFAEDSVVKFTDDLFSSLTEHIDPDNDDHDRVVIEFILPFSLLSLDVDQWKDDKFSTLGLDYKVNIRSRDRIHSKRARRFWKKIDNLKKDLQLKECMQKVCMTHSHVQMVQDAKDNENIKSIVFPIIEDIDYGLITKYIVQGLPILIWSRKSIGSSKKTCNIEERLGTTTLPKIPEKIKQIRCSGIEQEEHIGRHITLLWDDKTRRPPAPDLELTKDK